MKYFFYSNTIFLYINKRYEFGKLNNTRDELHKLCATNGVF